MSQKISMTDNGDQRSHRSQHIKNFDKLIGQFTDETQLKMYQLIEKKFELKKYYSERDWLTQNRQEVPQSFPLYERT